MKRIRLDRVRDDTGDLQRREKHTDEKAKSDLDEARNEHIHRSRIDLSAGVLKT
jgi:hypothetical protein